MGTRHRQAVINKVGDLKIQQYGQWDGCPSEQGRNILTYLRNGDLEKYHNELDKLDLITPEQVKEVENDKNWQVTYPYLSRDCGAKIHQMVENGTVKFVEHIEEEEAKRWCEWFYTIDFQKNVFITESYDCKIEIELDNLPTEKEYLEMFTED